MLLHVTTEQAEVYRHQGFSVPAGTWAAGTDTMIEVPSALHAGFDLSRGKSIGAFTYSWSKITDSVESIGRYCSIAGGVEFGLQEHEPSWLSTSSFSYDPLFMRDFAEQNQIRYSVNDLPDAPKRQGIKIGNDVWIGAHAFIRGGVSIGDGAVIGTRAVVTRDVEPYSIVVGTPARNIRLRFPEKTVERLLALKWWRFAYFHFRTDVTDVDRAIAEIEDMEAVGKIEPYKPQTIHLAGDLPSALPPNFSPGQYLYLNPDVAASGMDAAEHFLKFGYREGRRFL